MKKFSLLLLAAVAATSLLSLQGAPMDAAQTTSPFRIHILSSSHQDIAWMDSPEACIVFRDENCITPALEMMRTHPDYRFVMENMLNLREYLERHPDRRAEIERYTREGRMEWGATYTQPYESLLTGEELVRQVYFGRRWLVKNFPGSDAKVYFNPDVPGRALQMQQILSKAGVPYMVISRYHEGFYRWTSPDGSSVLAFTPGHYGNSSALLNAKPDEAAVKAIAAKLEKIAPSYRQGDWPAEFPLLHSEDFSKPTDYRQLIALWNRTHPGTTMQYSSARDFFEALDKGKPAFPKVEGERPNMWLYIHGPTHQWAIDAHRRAGVLLPAAEMFSVVAAVLEGGWNGYPAGPLTEAWRCAVYPDHGWGGKEGQVTDRLFRKTYEFAADTGEALLAKAQGSIARRIRTDAAKGIPAVVFNDLAWPRTGPVVVEIPKPAGSYAIRDSAGQAVPFQALPPLPGQAGNKERVEFVACDIPPAGYATYYMKPGGGEESASSSPSRPGVYENDFYRAEFAAGGLRSLFDKRLGREVIKTDKLLGFEVFTMKSVGNGAGEFGRVQAPTMEGFDRLSLHHPAWTFVAGESGPVKDVFMFRQVLADCTVEEKLIFYKALKRIDCEVALLGWDGSPYREYRLAVPVAAEAAAGRVAYEVPMGVVEVGKSEAKGTGGPAYGKLVYDQEMSDIRPREVQNFLYAGDGALGVTMTTSVAVNDYVDPTDHPVAYPVLQAVLLASRRSCHGQGNWYLQEGDHHYRFSLTSHAPGWRNGYKDGIAVNHDLRTVLPAAAGADASLPEKESFFAFSAGNVLFGTIKKAEDDDGVILRCYDIEGKPAQVRLGGSLKWAGAETTNIIELEGKPLPSEGGAVSFKVGPYAIETLKLMPKGK
ncbi:MAG: glycosyl hydrolase-related protein [Acidobacteriota bacterium]|nr:glycosyl hydrolase-related protein [Acidobacteriota bacterium]